MNQLGELFTFLYGLGLLGKGEDVLVWNVVGAKGQFSIRSFYRCLVGEVGGMLPWRSI